MIDFMVISTRSTKRGVIEIYPKFIIKKSTDLMIRGGDFYAIWIEERGLWSTDEQDALQLIDRELDRYAEENRQRFNSDIKVLHMWDAESGMIDSWHKYCQKQMRDSFHTLDDKLIFSNTETNKKDYASKKLNYPLEAGDLSAYEKLMSTLYSEEERTKIEWAIGSIVSGESKKLQKFMVLYGAAGTGKSTVLNIIQQLFDGYYSVFDAKALGSSSNSFALEAFKTNPLVAIQHDGDLSRIEDNTRLNSLVSHELMTVNEKFKSTYSNRFKCFLFMGTNKPVKITDAKSGLIRRLIDVSPSGNKLNPKEYKTIVKQVEFELGAIAYHCQEVYLSNPGRYDDYIPSEIGKGLAGIGGLLAELAVFTNLAGNAKHVMSTGVALIAIGAAMKIFASAVKDFGQLQWDEIGRGLTAMGGALAEAAIAVNLMPKNMIGIGTGLVIVGAALEIIANCMSKFGGMQWEEIGRGLTVMGGALAELAISLNFMKGTLGGSAALLVASGALAVLAPVLSILGALSWEAIAKGLISIAGAFTIIGVAGAVLTPLVPTILALSGAFALIGVGVLTIGAGLLAAGTGLSSLAIGFTALATAGAAGATAIVAALTVIVTGIAGLIPAVLTKVGEGIIAICKVIAAGAPAIGEAVKAVILTLIDVFVSCVPQLADGALQLVVGVLAALATYTPQIVDLAFKFLIGILEGIASNLPSLIKAGIDVLMAFFTGVVDALSGIDTGALLKGIAGIGLLSAIMLALSATAALVPGAMVGILGIGAVVAEMALVLAAVGLLSKLPGLSWLIGEGGKLLQGIGTAIGQFVGGIVGGFMSGVSSQFPQIGADLSAFMNNVQPFLQGASQIQPSMMDGVKALAETVLILTAADILQGLTSWLTGGSSLSKFGEELVPFGEAMRDFSLAIGNMDGEIVANAATAGKALAEMAATIPNTGGLVSFFAGENDMTAFGKQLVPFGEAMKQFGDAITGLDANAVTEAAIAGKAMAEMATTIPNSGGVVGFFAGENDMGEFGKQLVPFGEAMKAFGDAVRGLEADAIVNSATAGKALVELADTVPNTGGVVAFFTGNNDVDTFGEKLVPFGEAMKAYSEAIMGMDSAAITNSATAGKALVELANTIPNTGGLVSWFTGDNDLGGFGDSLVQFGSGIKSYSDSISGIDTGIMSSVITQVNRLVEMAKGMAELDTSGMSGFSTALTQLGNNGIDSFINAFTDASGRVTSAATSMLTTFINAANAQKSNMTSTFTTMMQAVLTTLTNYQTQFNTAGSTLMTKFITGIKSQDGNTKTAITNIISGCVTAINNKQTQFNTAGANLMIKLIAGIKSKDYETRNAFVNILSSCLTAIANKYPEFQNAGMQCMIKFIAGIKEKAEEVKTAFTGNLNASVTAIRDYHDQFKQAGAYLVEGFADGISENTYRAEAKARAMARAAAEAAEDELDEHSPSRVGYHIGDFFGLGFVNAIGTYAVKAYNASADMAKSAKTGLGNAITKVKDMIDNGVDTQPMIRPILDLSDIEEKSHQLNTLFSRSQALTVSTGIAASRERNLQNEDTNPNTGNSYKFVQNNYSPKALSRTEIYRQTKNQFSAMERMVET